MRSLNFPDELHYEINDKKIRFTLDDISTNWMDCGDSFTERIQTENLNPIFLKDHIIKEIEMKNLLDKGVAFLNEKKYPKAVRCFDEVIFYDENYAEALLYKSFSLKGQKHFVKSLRYYKKAVKASFQLKDVEYHKSLLADANSERDNFPKLKLNIYAGDEFFSKNDFKSAVESYDKALINPSKFKDKILFKLLNKKGTALLKLKIYDEAMQCFSQSLAVSPNDYARFGIGFCQYHLGLELSSDFRKALEIDKKHMLKQVMILNDLGFYKDSLDICDELFEIHFSVDDFYYKLLNARKYCLSQLDMDVTSTDEMLTRLFG